MSLNLTARLETIKSKYFMFNMIHHSGIFSLRVYALFTLLILGSGCAVMSGYHSGISCNRCHEGRATAEEKALKSPDNPSITCKGCHLYEVDSDHHPSLMRPGIFGESALIPEEFKLYNDKMECLTCHEMHKNKDNLAGERYFLIGSPYADRKDICRRCHQNNKQVNMDPHSNYGYVAKERKSRFAGKECLVCHYPSNGKSYKDDVSLRASDAFICWKCHEVMQGDFLSKHYLLKEFSGDEAMNYSGLQAEADPDLHLDPFGRITCTTCHDPHRPYDAVSVKNGRGRIPMRSKKVCSNCHGNYFFSFSW
ncbi:MAG: cytochrome c3 family protein [bacterium]|nr:cytochrome c3 family protein [bacterium]